MATLCLLKHSWTHLVLSYFSGFHAAGARRTFLVAVVLKQISNLKNLGSIFLGSEVWCAAKWDNLCCVQCRIVEVPSKVKALVLFTELGNCWGWKSSPRSSAAINPVLPWPQLNHVHFSGSFINLQRYPRCYKTDRKKTWWRPICSRINLLDGVAEGNRETLMLGLLLT